MDAWQTHAFEFKGGLITNLSPLQQGTQAPGSARILTNFEPSTEGGYKRVLGYEKYDEAYVPFWGRGFVQGSGQTGTTLVVGGISEAPAEESTIYIGEDEYVIAAGGVTYNETSREVTLILTTSIAVAYADKTEVTFSNDSSTVITGIAAWDGDVVAVRGENIYFSDSEGFSLINVPSYGTVLVNGAGQTGTSLVVDGLTDIPQIGDILQIAGVNKVYAITAVPTVTSGGATLSISPSLASSPADNAALTFISTPFVEDTKSRFTRYRIGSNTKIAGVNGAAVPFTYTTGVFKKLTSNPDIVGSTSVSWFKNSLFFAKGDQLTFTAPFTDDDFSPANGAGVINVGDTITSLVVFREQLIIFCQQSIHRITGNTIADFALEPITRKIGCVDGDSVQEIGGDIMYLAPDGLRLLSATDRIGDFGLASKSKAIQKELTDLTLYNQSVCSVVIKSKSQYRMFGYNPLYTVDASQGVVGTQMDEAGTFEWAQLAGFKAYVADSDYSDGADLVVFANNDGYVYKMESGYSFDGENIRAVFATPYVHINDPRIRKTFYKLHIYLEPQGSVEIDVNLKLDFDNVGSVQPSTISLSNITETVGLYGAAPSLYGEVTFGDKLKRVFETPVIGSGFSVSLQFISDSISPPFSFDAATLEYMSHDRR